MLITLVVFIALLPASIFTAYMLTRDIYNRISINAASINAVLCHSAEIRSSLQLDGDAAMQTNRFISDYVNSVDNREQASVAVFDRDKNLRVLYNPGEVPDFMQTAQELVCQYAGSGEISWQENYDIPNRALGFVRDKDDNILGYIVTGYSGDLFNKSTLSAIIFILLMMFTGLLVGIVGATYLARHIKKELFDMEPEEIAARLMERNIILNSVREGVININQYGIITLVNTEAKSLLAEAGIKNSNDLVGRDAKTVLSNLNLDDILTHGKVLYYVGAKIGSTVFIATAVPLLLEKKIIGVVITFRQKSTVEEIANQLTGFKNYAAALRAQTHEFVNKMHVIMGLIDMKAYDELKKYTQEIASNRQSEVSYILTRLKDITLAGFILGKISRSRELDIEFHLTEESELHSELEVPSVHDLVLIIGNIVENAFDVLKNYSGERVVNLSILDFDTDIVVIVEDSGPGMDEETKKNIFKQGYTSKGEGHGFGLSLVQNSIDNLDGSITVESNPGEGTIFFIRLPVKKGGVAND